MDESIHNTYMEENSHNTSISNYRINAEYVILTSQYSIKNSPKIWRDISQKRVYKYPISAWKGTQYQFFSGTGPWVVLIIAYWIRSIPRDISKCGA